MPMAEPHEQPDDFENPPSFFPFGEGEEIFNDFEPGEPVEVSVEGVFFTETQNSIQRFVLLSDGERKLPILIGAFEAQAIIMELEDNKADRPMPHDLIKAIIDRLSATIERIVIDDVWKKTYYAKLHIHHEGTTTELDCRPSDAIAVALRFGAPIYVCDGILRQETE